VWHEDVDEAEDGHERHTDNPHTTFFPEGQQLEETHLSVIPDGRQMLLAVGMSYKLH